MAMIAYKCPDIEVVVVDINAARIAAWNSDVSANPPSSFTLLIVYICSLHHNSGNCLFRR